MIVRALSSTGDWTFGKGLNDYKSANAAVAQTIQTRLNSFLNNCFFDANAGIDWFTLLGGKDTLSLNLAVTAMILNTANVISLNQLYITLDTNRKVTISYTVQTTYSTVTDVVQVLI